MSVVESLLDIKDMTEKAFNSDRQMYVTKIQNRLQVHVNDVKGYRKELEAREKRLKDFQDQVDTVKTDEQLKKLIIDLGL